MEKTESKHLEKSFNRVIQSLYKEDREVVLDMVEHKYQSALQKSKLRSEFLKSVADHLPFFSLIMMLLLIIGSGVIMWIAISVNHEERLKNYKKEQAEIHSQEIDLLKHEMLGIKKFSNESIQDCVAKLVTCDCVNEGSK